MKLKQTVTLLSSSRKFKSEKELEMQQFQQRMHPMIDSINHKTDQLEQLLDMVEQHRKKLLT